jgi:hypothetical protein
MKAYCLFYSSSFVPPSRPKGFFQQLQVSKFLLNYMRECEVTAPAQLPSGHAYPGLVARSTMSDEYQRVVNDAVSEIRKVDGPIKRGLEYLKTPIDE